MLRKSVTDLKPLSTSPMPASSFVKTPSASAIFGCSRISHGLMPPDRASRRFSRLTGSGTIFARRTCAP
eukprot:1447032-Prymnesium_polylepis.1